MKIKPKFVYEESGAKKGVFLSSEDFEKLMNELDDLKSLYIARIRTQNKNMKLIPFEQVKKELGIHESNKPS
jgi:hypothetical protein